MIYLQVYRDVQYQAVSVAHLKPALGSSMSQWKLVRAINIVSLDVIM